ncbi:hypothetical protein J7E68_15590, partial [Microbacterium sp. ISL-103]|uniref:hypothetical protein n=1 Tax=Microbacterium sp. ISL-103 TaxID=2819156 RepID=UPI001BE69EB8
MHPRPGVVGISLVLIAAGQAGRFSRHDERSDRDATALERHRKMGGVLAQTARELERGGRAFDQDDADVIGVIAHADCDALVVKCVAHPVLASPVEHIDALDPGRGGRGRVVDEERLEAREEHARLSSEERR